MKRRSTIPTFTFAVLAVCSIVPGAEQPVVELASASTSSASPPPSSALVNDWLRDRSAAFNEWDLGGQFRVRYEIKEDGGSFPDRDFRRSGVDNDNSYLLLREKVHLGYTPVSWLAVYFEGRDSSTTGDDRNPNPEADQLDLHQAFVRIGDAKAFPLTARIGRQELVYGDERLVGNGY